MARKESSETPNLYILGFSEPMVRLHQRNIAETHAKHLMPRLKPGDRVLDIGCGPGNISIGLADAVKPGELYGIDIEPSQVEIANQLARTGGRDNATFQVADALALPFEDGSFDVVHCRETLMYIPDTQAALAEVMRVLKPGGLFSCREMICSSCFTHPDFGVLNNTWEIFGDIVAGDEGHPQMGKDLKLHAAESGFEDAEIGISFDLFASPEDVKLMYDAAQEWFKTPEVKAAATNYGAGTQQLFDRLLDAYDQWLKNPGAICGLGYGELLARKP